MQKLFEQRHGVSVNYEKSWKTDFFYHVLAHKMSKTSL